MPQEIAFKALPERVPRGLGEKSRPEAERGLEQGGGGLDQQIQEGCLFVDLGFGRKARNLLYFAALSTLRKLRRLEQGGGGLDQQIQEGCLPTGLGIGIGSVALSPQQRTRHPIFSR